MARKKNTSDINNGTISSNEQPVSANEANGPLGAPTNPPAFDLIRGRKRYRNTMSTLLAHNGTAPPTPPVTYLYRTSNNNYFRVVVDPGDSITLFPMMVDEAIMFWEAATIKIVATFALAFPNVTVQDA